MIFLDVNVGMILMFMFDDFLFLHLIVSTIIMMVINRIEDAIRSAMVGKNGHYVISSMFCPIMSYNICLQHLSNTASYQIRSFLTKILNLQILEVESG